MKKRFVSLVLAFVLILSSLELPVQAKSLTLSYNGKTVVYSGKQIKVTCDGSNIGLSKTPGIMMGAAGYAMLPYYETFVTSSIKAKRTYYSSTKTLVLTYKNNSLKMTLNKRTAYLNGKKVTLPVAPVSVKYKNSGVTRILVPSRTIASYFNLKYQWNSATSTVVISANNNSTSSSASSGSTTKATYIMGGKTYTLIKRNVVYKGTSISVSNAPACVIGGYNMVSYYYTFVKNGPKISRTYSSSTKTLTLTSTVNGNKNQLIMKVGSKSATLNGKSVTLPKAPVFIKFSKTGSNLLYVPAQAVGTLLGFSYSYNSSSATISYIPGLSIKMDGAYSVYTRTKVGIMANNTKVTTSIPGILIDDTTLIPANAVCQSKYGLDVSYSYVNKKATFKRGSNTVVVTMGSKNALVNSKTVAMPVEAKLIMLTSNGTTYVMVPGSFVTTALGLTYRYSSGTSYISGSALTDNGDSNADTPAYNPDTSFQTTMTLLRPSGVKKGTIVCTDDYQNRRLIISMPGDQRTYYETHKPALASGVTFSTVYSSSANKTSLYFKTSKINGFKIKEDDNYIYIQNGTPTSIYKNVIVLDAGHGGSDSGATGNGYKEKDFTLSIVKNAKSYFDQNSKYKVYYTRLTDTYPSLSKRYSLANEVEADIFISVHINSAGETATGTETLYNPDRNKTASSGLSCYKLTAQVQKNLLASTGFKDRGLKERCTRLGNGLAVLNHNNGPATLTEIGFISNPAEAKSMASHLGAYGKAVYDAVISATSNYPTKR